MIQGYFVVCTRRLPDGHLRVMSHARPDWASAHETKRAAQAQGCWETVDVRHIDGHPVAEQAARQQLTLWGT